MSYCSWLMSFMISDIMICALMFSYQQECFNTNGCWLSVPEIAPVDAKGPFSLQKEAVWTGDQSHRLPRQEEWGGAFRVAHGPEKGPGAVPRPATLLRLSYIITHLPHPKCLSSQDICTFLPGKAGSQGYVHPLLPRAAKHWSPSWFS